MVLVLKVIVLKVLVLIGTITLSLSSLDSDGLSCGFKKSLFTTIL